MQLSIMGKFFVPAERRFPVVLGVRGEEMENIVNVLLEPVRLKMFLKKYIQFPAV